MPRKDDELRAGNPGRNPACLLQRRYVCDTLRRPDVLALQHQRRHTDERQHFPNIHQTVHHHECARSRWARRGSQEASGPVENGLIVEAAGGHSADPPAREAGSAPFTFDLVDPLTVILRGRAPGIIGRPDAGLRDGRVQHQRRHPLRMSGGEEGRDRAPVHLALALPRARYRQRREPPGRRPSAPRASAWRTRRPGRTYRCPACRRRSVAKRTRACA